MISNHLEALASQAAHLLPEAPGAHDPFGYLAWEELVLSTARRLGASADAPLGQLPGRALSLDGRTGRLTGTALLVLADLAAGSDPAAGELALAAAYAGRCAADVDGVDARGPAGTAPRSRCRAASGRGRLLASHGR